MEDKAVQETVPAATSAGASANASVKWFVLRFLGVLIVFYTAYALSKRSDAFEAHRAFIATVSTWLIGVPFDGVTRAGTLITHPDQAGLAIGEGCDAIYAILCFVGGVLAFASSWRAKLLGLAVGLLVIEILNVVRIVSLFVIQRYAPDYFHVAHTAIWEVVFVLAAVTMWSVWAVRVQGEGKPRADTKPAH